MKTLKLYVITKNYIDYLRKFDSKVPYNKNDKRPYIGVVYTFNNFNYFAPLSSPKIKHIKMSNKAIDIFKIDGGKLGVVNLNNMIPVPKKCLVDLFDIVKDEKYKILLENQLSYINNNRIKLLNKVIQFHREYNKGHLDKKVLDRCCDFRLLENKCLNYDK